MKSTTFKVLLFVVCAVRISTTTAQDLFDYEHSMKYANYLFNTKRFDFATKEYQRVLFMQPQEKDAWLKLIKSFQALGEYRNSLLFLDSAETHIGNSKQLNLLRAYSLLKTDKYKQLDFLLQESQLDAKDRNFLNAAAYAKSGNWTQLSKKPKENNYYLQAFHQMAKDIEEDKPKSKVLAGMMSAVIPGSGKVYCKRKKDGLFSFLLVASSAWQAYRFVSKKGIDNFGSIFFGGFAVGLYTGNIYGSVKAAKLYNSRLERKYYEKTDHLLDMYFYH